MNWLNEAQQLSDAGEAFAVATVLRRVAPASAQPGAKAVILPNGTMHGWVGGSCAQPVVVAEARQALRDGAPRLLRLGHMPGEGGGHADAVVEYPMTCHSGGALEILIEPVLPAARLAVVGETPVAQTLARLAEVMGYRVSLLDRADELPNVIHGTRPALVVAASMGVDDEAALLHALRARSPYVALVASPKRASVVRETLLASGLTLEALSHLKAPAGLDIGARTQEEIALSIMAEIAQVHAAMAPGIGDEPASTGKTNTALADVAIDPVCGMAVEIATARHFSDFDGQSWYFCCGGCKARFDADPGAYAAA